MFFYSDIYHSYMLFQYLILITNNRIYKKIKPTIMKKLIYLFFLIAIVACSSDDSSIINNEASPNPVYLDVNGITIKAREWAEVGAMGEINGITYTVVDEVMLRELVTNNQDLTKLATTKVTDVSSLFASKNDFNQSIGNWDMSNVDTMKGMFANTTIFNQDISSWNVGKVVYMGGMFYHSSGINQDLSLWDVSIVDQCDSFGSNTPQWTLPKPNFTNCNS